MNIRRTIRGLAASVAGLTMVVALALAAPTATQAGGATSTTIASSTSIPGSTSLPSTTAPPATSVPPPTISPPPTGPPPTTVAAAPDAATSGSSVLAEAPAGRETPPSPWKPQLLFPMDPQPRCEVLDNFGDPRSGGRSHEGTDILASLGQAVYAVESGTVTTKTAVGAPNASLSGNSLVVTRADRSYYMYAHLSAFEPGIDRGSRVAAGQVIGYVGDTGNPGAGNYHLHFEVHPSGGAAVNALTLTDIPPGCKVY